MKMRIISSTHIWGIKVGFSFKLWPTKHIIFLSNFQKQMAFWDLRQLPDDSKQFPNHPTLG